MSSIRRKIWETAREIGGVWDGQAVVELSQEDLEALLEELPVDERWQDTSGQELIYRVMFPSRRNGIATVAVCLENPYVEADSDREVLLNDDEDLPTAPPVEVPRDARRPGFQPDRIQFSSPGGFTVSSAGGFTVSHVEGVPAVAPPGTGLARPGWYYGGPNGTTRIPVDLNPPGSDYEDEYRVPMWDEPLLPEED